MTVTADRKDGFDGPIDVELRDLPAGLTATPGRIPAGADTTVLMLAAGRGRVVRRAEGDAAVDVRRAPAGTYDVPGVAALTLVGPRDDRRPHGVPRSRATELVSVIALAPQPDLVVTTDARADRGDRRARK